MSKQQLKDRVACCMEELEQHDEMSREMYAHRAGLRVLLAERAEAAAKALEAAQKPRCALMMEVPTAGHPRFVAVIPGGGAQVGDRLRIMDPSGEWLARVIEVLNMHTTCDQYDEGCSVSFAYVTKVRDGE